MENHPCVHDFNKLIQTTFGARVLCTRCIAAGGTVAHYEETIDPATSVSRKINITSSAAPPPPCTCPAESAATFNSQHIGWVTMRACTQCGNIRMDRTDIATATSPHALKRGPKPRQSTQSHDCATGLHKFTKLQDTIGGSMTLCDICLEESPCHLQRGDEFSSTHATCTLTIAKGPPNPESLICPHSYCHVSPTPVPHSNIQMCIFCGNMSFAPTRHTPRECCMSPAKVAGEKQDAVNSPQRKKKL